ncbi:MAG: leucyl aminopeptidase [Bauldia sp.]|uniref:leucyl aminopeptidase n=1 Tax=Bauldia sp. TaxID=2575872 RepID=UPI001D6470F1|nr:leucyl aminopeptidase [Bauldia sp.]MCB1495902.1 leucyl aminopeptidase [Bauldia sp.]
MTVPTTFSFAKPGRKPTGTVVVLAGADLLLGSQARALGVTDLIIRAAATASFTGKAMATLDLLAPAGTDFDRLIVVGTGNPAGLSEYDWLRLGGAAMGALGRAKSVMVLAERPDGKRPAPGQVADFALGMRLRAYAYDKFKTGKKSAGAGASKAAITITCADPSGARKAWSAAEAIGEGVVLARDLVNEPANLLGPVEFARKASELKKLGVKVQILAEPELKKLDMAALLGVSQGSSRPPRVAVMQWQGGKAKDAPVTFIGKGVVFDTGGISIKPAANMENMKGDMGGAATVVGLMKALAGRKAKVNAVGIIGLVENMPDGAAQRPGDIVTAKSGKTIEIINTDAEGRLVLCDLLTYAEERFKPKLMVDLATLTGAILVALGNYYAGMFANDDGLAEALLTAGRETGEGVWRMPLDPEYDKMIDSKFADMKNVGGRYAGSVTAAQFLQRFVEKTPWAHLDVAGTAMDSRQTEINQSWGSGWGVRLLDRMVADRYET